MASKILYVSTSTTVGGAEKTLYTLATLVNPQFYPLAGVVTLKPKGFYAKRLEEAGVPVFSLDLKKPKAGVQELQKLAVIIQKTRPTIVHALMYQAMQLCRAARRLGYAEFKLVSSPRVHYRTRTGLSLWVDRLLKKSDDILISECEASRKYLVERLGYPPEKVVRVYNGVDIAGWPPSKAERRKRRAELGIKDDQFLIGAVGRLDAQKGHVYLLEAVAKLKLMQPVKCAIVGEGPLRRHLEETIKRLGLKEDVRLVGEQDDVPSWLSAFDVFVQPSLWEGLPNAMMEAMALGLPVVATRVDGVPEAVAHEISGLLCAPKDSQALVTPIQDLIADPGLRARLGEGARQVISQNFTLIDMIHNYESAYAKLAPREGA